MLLAATTVAMTGWRGRCGLCVPGGRRIAETARSGGHQVTVFVRTPGRLGPHPGLREVTGDVLNAEAVAAAVPGHDAVISALGHSRPLPSGHDLRREAGSATPRPPLRGSLTRAAEFGALLREHPADLIDPLEVAVAEAVQPVADLMLRLKLEVVQVALTLRTRGECLRCWLSRCRARRFTLAPRVIAWMTSLGSSSS